MESEPSNGTATTSNATTVDSNAQISAGQSSALDLTVNVNRGQQQQQQQQRPKQNLRLKKCSFEECKETMLRGKSGPWMCKYHRNKTYKETYKKKKGKHNQTATQQKKMMSNMSGESSSPTLGNLYSSREHQQEQISMLGQVLNEKKLALMKSPMVQTFLQEQQSNLCNKRQQTLGLPNQMM